jgi:hypothetical protein
MTTPCFSLFLKRKKKKKKNHSSSLEYKVTQGGIRNSSLALLNPGVYSYCI